VAILSLMQSPSEPAAAPPETRAPAPPRQRRPVSSARGAVLILAGAAIAGGAGWVLSTLSAVHGGGAGF